MSETIVIDNVNTELLEEQRLALVRVLFGLEEHRPAFVREDDLELLNGILHMLDHWSDTYTERKHAPKPPSNRRK